jgi:hypothetical protein
MKTHMDCVLIKTEKTRVKSGGRKVQGVDVVKDKDLNLEGD